MLKECFESSFEMLARRVGDSIVVEETTKGYGCCVCIGDISGKRYVHHDNATELWIQSWWNFMCKSLKDYCEDGVVWRKAFALNWFDKTEMSPEGWFLSAFDDNPEASGGANIEVCLSDTSDVWLPCGSGWYGSIAPELQDEALQWLNSLEEREERGKQ